ncbi:hypothetical protein [Oceanobacillus profundus]|uniref:hypothetical protein n=1 Tax=Oceanobacillus TaxID=182709 RepID=UPI000BA596A0|nr:hypothetical protein [Oceanobacillus profundus]MCM3399793.1 hypothetical protein [Oceanobacillus profundus]MDO6449956.1 hypothetical protein [Oceanobacillus profundus]PAE28169.1 hypothetical protein CHI07_15415 [Paenibacillus sp. 7884-2]
MNEKNLYILLTDTGTVFTRLIKSYTKKPYNHASISFDPQLVNAYSFGRKKPRNPLIGGFVQENMRSGLFKHASAAIYSCTVNEDQLQKINAYLQKIEAEKEQYRYNFLGLFGVILNKPINREKAFFCSQFVASVLKECDILDFSKPVSLITPHDIQEVGNFQLVYKGKLADFYADGNHIDIMEPSFNMVPLKI